MNSNEEQVRAAIAEQAGEWFVANDEAPLDERDAAKLAAWFKTSPVHIEEFLGVSAIAQDLKAARSDPEYSLEAILARARAEEEPSVQSLRPSVDEGIRDKSSRRRLTATVALAACALVSVALLVTWNIGPFQHASAPDDTAALHFETRHGQQLSSRLSDNSVVHLNTDSAVTIRYSKTERLVMLTSGQADFEVAHEPDRAFRVVAGAAEVVDLGTQFDVRLQHDSTVVTVVEGRVAVGAAASQNRPQQYVQLGANQQTSVLSGEGPTTPITVDAQRSTSWLRREMTFDHEPLERVVAEYNRYTPKPIEIATPALRSLQISGVFATDDTEAFIAFLRSLKGVRVEVTATQVRVSGE
jgi:transmembrane sensor